VLTRRHLRDCGKCAPWQVATNTFGVMALTQAVLPQFRTRRSGAIVNVTSSATLAPMPLVAVDTNILLALHSLGYVAAWKTGEAAYDTEVKKALGFAADDHLVGFICTGGGAGATFAPGKFAKCSGCDARLPGLKPQQIDAEHEVSEAHDAGFGALRATREPVRAHGPKV
jgi:hypothetical protein